VSTPAAKSANRPTFVGYSTSQKLASLILLLLASAIMLPLLFPPFYCFFLAPIVLVPFAIAIIRRPMKWRYALAYYLLGVAFFLPNLFWIAPVTFGGYIALALFVALYFPLFAWGFHRLVVQFRMPATFALPLAWTAVEYARATFIEGGFPWFILGNCLTPAPILLQTADLFGVWTLTFLICMCNGFVVDFLRLPLKRNRKFNPTIGWLLAATSASLAFAISYGLFRLNQSTLTPGPRVAVIQENFPQDLKDNGDPFDRFMRHVALTKIALTQTPKPDLVAWPETMVPGWGNREFLTAPNSAFAHFEHPDYWPENRDASIQYMQALTDLATNSSTPLLIGIGGLTPRTDLNDSIKQNLTILMVPTLGAVQQYAKIHLVPFGEYIPFKTIPLLGRLVVYLTPIDFDYSNTPGTEWTQFTLLIPPDYSPKTIAGTTLPFSALPAGTPGVYRFATPICFEDAMPEPCRMMTHAPGFIQSPSFTSPAKTDFLINVSNDGWFHSVELDQHLQACQLRAVENRVPIARSVNTGDSGFIDSDGRILKLVTDPVTGSSIHAVGTATEQLSLDSRISLFSRIGDILPITCGILATLLIAYTYARPRRTT